MDAERIWFVFPPDKMEFHHFANITVSDRRRTFAKWCWHVYGLLSIKDFAAEGRMFRLRGAREYGDNILASGKTQDSFAEHAWLGIDGHG